MENKISESKILGIIILIIVGLIILISVFRLGIVTGAKKADFSFKWAEAYHQNFGGPAKGFFTSLIDDGFSSANGAFGQVIKIDYDKLTIKGRDNVKKIIALNNKTAIVGQRSNLKIADLKIGDEVVVIGEPADNGVIEGKFIRVLSPRSTPSVSKILKWTQIQKQYQ